MQEPKDLLEKVKIEQKVINHWLSKTKISKDKAYPKKVVYTKGTNNKKLANYGSLIIEKKKNLLSQIFKKFVKDLSYSMPNQTKEEIIYFMKGIIAGEGCVENRPQDCKKRVHINAIQQVELDLFEDCLRKLGIESKQYQGNKLIISKRENLVKLLNLRLMTGQKSKYAKFRYMMEKYPGIKEETGYFQDKGVRPKWNQYTKEHILEVEQLLDQGLSTKQVSEKLGIHRLKVQRIQRKLKGKKFEPTSNQQKKNIIYLHWENPARSSKSIAHFLGVHPSRVERYRRKKQLKKQYLNEQIEILAKRTELGIHPVSLHNPAHYHKL